MPPTFVIATTSAPATCRSPASPRSWRTASAVWPKPACSRPPDSWPAHGLGGGGPRRGVDASAGRADAGVQPPPRQLAAPRVEREVAVAGDALATVDERARLAGP